MLDKLRDAVVGGRLVATSVVDENADLRKKMIKMENFRTANYGDGRFAIILGDHTKAVAESGHGSSRCGFEHLHRGRSGRFSHLNREIVIILHKV